MREREAQVTRPTKRLRSAVTESFRNIAQAYIRIRKPIVVAVAGSVGKTSSKLFLAHILSSEKRVSYMDDSYNNGLGLYLSVFRLKVPTASKNPFSWILLFLKACLSFLDRSPDVLIMEYGIDHPGDMDELIRFAQPDFVLLTAVTPEHMEFFKTLDGVAQEEIKIVDAARNISVINSVDVNSGYFPADAKILLYGSRNDAGSYEIVRWTKTGAEINVQLQKQSLQGVAVHIISEPLIRQLTGAALLAYEIGISIDSIKIRLATARPAASRMRLLSGINDSLIVDDSTNFSPSAGIEALNAIKKIPGRHIVIFGNMHELGEYAKQGFHDVGVELRGIDIVVLVGDLAIPYFSPYAIEAGLEEGISLFTFNTSVEAGAYVRDKIAKKDDIILVKGPFGGLHMEEAVKKLLLNPEDSTLLTRQSDFWIRKKRKKFGNLLDI